MYLYIFITNIIYYIYIYYMHEFFLSPTFTCSNAAIEKTFCEICSKWSIKTPEWRQQHHSFVFIAAFKQIQQMFKAHQ